MGAAGTSCTTRWECKIDWTGCEWWNACRARYLASQSCGIQENYPGLSIAVIEGLIAIAQSSPGRAR